MIKTNNFQLIPCERIHLEAFARGKHELGVILQVTIPENWPTFPEAFSLPDDPSPETSAPLNEWGGYFFIHTQDKALVGNGGFTGEPDALGGVELGYEIASEFWNRGYATEIVQGMLDFAFSHARVQRVIAHTLAAPNASNSVLKKVGMTFVAEMDDPEAGKIWRWQIRRSASPS